MANLHVDRFGTSTWWNTASMVDQADMERAMYQALKAVDEVAAALQVHLVHEHDAHPEAHSESPSQAGTNSAVRLLGIARERLGEGLRDIEAHLIHHSDGISLRSPQMGPAG